MSKQNFKSEVKKVFKVRVEGGNCYQEFKTEEEAKEGAKEMVKEAEKEWEETNGEEARKQQELEYVERDLNNYVDHLKKELWYMARDKDVNNNLENKKEVVEEIKKIRSHLLGILNGTKKVEWHQGWGNGADSYTIEDVKDYGRGDKE